MERGWDEVELARRADVSRTTLYHFRLGKIRRPRITTLSALAAAFELPLNRFLWGHSEPPGPAVSSRSGSAQEFDRSTNQAIRQVHEEHPELFTGWTDREWEELYSTFGVGGALNEDGVITNARQINESRRTRRQLDVVLETHLREVASRMIECLYRMVVPEGNLSPGAELEALIAARFQEETASETDSSGSDRDQ
jgi:transcriptional regulator with XRE-family HTH domain